MEAQHDVRGNRSNVVGQLLLWYGALVAGGMILLARMVGWLAREVSAILRSRRDDRVYPFIKPTKSIPTLISTIVVGLSMYALNITLVLPLFMGIGHVVSLAAQRLRPSDDLSVEGNHGDEEPVGRNWHYYDGDMYEITIDPLERELKQVICEYVAPGSKVIDICCGPGTISFELARKCRQVVGVDHALGMIRYADEQRRNRRVENVRFIHADATHLAQYESGAFDYAIISMAIHEMTPESGIGALEEARRVAKQVIVADYAVPLPINASGLLFRYLEVIAGLNHFKGFLRYSRRGGLDPLLAQGGLGIRQETTVAQGAVRVVKALPEGI